MLWFWTWASSSWSPVLKFSTRREKQLLESLDRLMLLWTPQSELIQCNVQKSDFFGVKLFFEFLTIQIKFRTPMQSNREKLIIYFTQIWKWGGRKSTYASWKIFFQRLNIFILFAKKPSCRKKTFNQKFKWLLPVTLQSWNQLTV